MITGNRLYGWAEDLFPICRSISGQGVRQSLKYLKKILPELKIKTINSGSKVYDWTVPDEWEIKDAYIKNKDGKKIVDFKKNNLHVLGYSSPIKKKIKKNFLLKKLYYLKNKPNAIPYVTSYYKKRWGFCVQFNLIKKLKDKYYYVNIDSSFKDSKKGGVLNYGELFIKGKSKKEILISTNICHPSLGNNELSGVLIATSLGYWLSKKKKLNYSYRVLYLPETIGSISYIKKNKKKLKNNVVAGFQVVCVGDNNQFSYLPSRSGKSLADLAARKALNSLNIKYKKYSFLDRGSDERQYCSPGVDLPVCSIMRSKYGTYPEYHNSKDNLNFISPNGLIGSHNVLKKAIDFIEKKGLKIKKNKIKISKSLRGKPSNEVFYRRSDNNLCEPFLTKYKLYPTLSFFRKSNKKNINDVILNFFAYLDGKTSINEISKKIKVKKKILKRITKTLEKKRLIKKIL